MWFLDKENHVTIINIPEKLMSFYTSPNAKYKGSNMQYPLSEEIGNPDLFVGRKKELAMLDNWIKLIPKKLGKSKALFSRRKGGKTSLVQRLFNRLWNENGEIGRAHV